MSVSELSALLYQMFYKVLYNSLKIRRWNKTPAEAVLSLTPACFKKHLCQVTAMQQLHM